MAGPDRGLVSQGTAATLSNGAAVGSDAVSARGRYWVETWGCQMNVYDSERIAGQLRELGYEQATELSRADVILLNTCSIRERAAEKIFSWLGMLRPIKRQNPRLIVGVAGCVAQQEQDQILVRSDIADFVVGTRALPKMAALVEQAMAGKRTVDVADHQERFDEPRPIARRVPHRAYVTVVEGCNKSCSFCIVPFTRGPEVNRTPASILEEIATAVSGGAREIELLGQNVNAYNHGGTDFAALLRLVGAMPGVSRLRFTTSHPRELNDAVIRAMSEIEVLGNHLHLPVQSGSNSVLKRMHRGYDRERYLSRIAKLRNVLPGIALSTDIIVGFPGETEAEFADTMRLLDEVDFDQVYAFVFSARPRTRAADLDDPTPLAEKEDRLRRLFVRQDVIMRRRNSAFLGRTVRVLVDGRSPRGEGMVNGRASDNRVVNFAAPDEEIGRFCDVRITRALEHSLVGERIGNSN